MSLALFSDVDGVRQVWCVDDRGEVRPVPEHTLTLTGDPEALLRQRGWRYATADEYAAARERALNSTDN